MLKRKIALFNERESFGNGSKWFRGPLIGRGRSCSVFVSNLKPGLLDGDDAQHKVREKMAVKSTKNPHDFSLLRGEKYILETVRQGCPYIVECLGVEETIGNTGEKALNLLLEHGDGGSLRALIRRNFQTGLPEEEVRVFTKCIAEGLRHIHARGYMHRDLKPDNIILVTKPKPLNEPKNDSTDNNAGEGVAPTGNIILVTRPKDEPKDDDSTDNNAGEGVEPTDNIILVTKPKDEPKDDDSTDNNAGEGDVPNTTEKLHYIAKICDFGCAKDFTKIRKMKIDPYLRGNIRYLSPEAAVTNRQGKEGDVWALGCIVFEMLTGESVWRMASDLEVEMVLLAMGNGVRHYAKVPGRISDVAINFMEVCLQIDPRCRWPAEMLLGHPFIKGV